MTWDDEEHILLANSQAEDNFCKTVKVIYEEVDEHGNVKKMINADGNEHKYLHEKNCFSSPFL